MAARRLLIDLTDLEKWPGIHGGIQRVVYGICKELFQEPPEGREIIFIAYDGESHRFYITDFRPIYERVEKIAPSQPEQPDIVENLTQKVKRKLGMAKTEHSAREWAVMSAEDTVLVMGMSWEAPGIQQTLANLRETKRVKVVQVVYDLVICLYPHLHHPANIEPYTKNMVELIQNSDLLLPISKSSDNDLKTFAKQQGLKIPPTKVIRLSDKSVDSKGKSTKPSNDIAKEFIACVGTVEVRKNHALLYYVYKLAAERNIDLPQLVVVGGRGWYTGDLQHILDNDPAIKGKILLLSGVDDSGLKWVFENCLFTVYPSMYEGWGLPVAESLANGKLCLASNSSSIPEIAGDLIDYFSPYSTDECLSLIQKYLDKSSRSEKEKHIKDKYQPTSWADTRRQIVSYVNDK